ncbi:MAG TPA: hypothetical protein VFU76_17205 [Terriglobales bacterium]|nr:hypothetical protein [Terriglobales bacterium]
MALLIFAGTMLAQAGAPAPTQASPDPSAQKAKAILDQMVQALGGQSWLTYQDFEQEGRTYSFYHGEPNSAGILYWRFWKFPDKDRYELTKQRDVVYVYNGDHGYELTYKGTAAMDKDQLADALRRQHHGLEVVIRQWLHAPGTALFYDGPAIAEQKPTDSVTIMNSANDAVTLFVDSNTHLPVKKSFSWRDPQYRELINESETYDNYRPVQGIMTPYTVLRYRGKEITNQRFISSMKYNTGVPDAKFQATVNYDPNKPKRKK